MWLTFGFVFMYRLREANRKKADFLRQNGRTEDANKALAGAVEIDFNLIQQFINVSLVLNGAVFKHFFTYVFLL